MKSALRERTRMRSLDLSDNVVFKELYIRDLAVDREIYQAPVNRARVSEMARHWDPNLCIPLAVSARAGGGYAVIDGGHRLAAAKKVGGIEKLPCWVYSGLSIEEEAWLFVAFSTKRRKISSYTNFRAMVASHDPTYEEAVVVLNRHGLTIKGIENAYGEDSSYAQIACAASIHKIVEQRGVSRLETVLAIIDACWADDQLRRHAATLRGLSYFLDLLWAAGHISPYNKRKELGKDFIAKMASWPLRKVMRRAAQDHPGTSDAASSVGDAFKILYNYRRTIHRI